MGEYYISIDLRQILKYPRKDKIKKVKSRQKILYNTLFSNCILFIIIMNF